MPPKPQLIDMIRTVPEIAVRLWCGGQVFPLEDGVRILYENREITVHKTIYEEAQKVARTIAIRWGGRTMTFRRRFWRISTGWMTSTC